MRPPLPQALQSPFVMLRPNNLPAPELRLPASLREWSLQGQVTAAVSSYVQTLRSMQELACKLPPDLAAEMQLKIEKVRSNMHQELEMSKLAEAAASAHRDPAKT